MGSPYYSKARLQAHASWANLHFDRFGFLIGDWLYALTLQATKGLGRSAAEKRALAMGNAMAQIIHEIVPSTGLDYAVLHWRDLMDNAHYTALHRAALQDYRSCPPFKAAVRAQVFDNLGPRIEGTGFEADPGRDTPATALFDSYILHEIAGLTVISEFLGYPVETYPGRDLAIMARVYGRAFPALAEVLPDRPQREFISLSLEP